MAEDFDNRSQVFEPTEPLPFVDGKCRILENPEYKRRITYINAIPTLGTTYLGSRLVRFHAKMGWASLSFQSLAFLGAAITTKMLSSGVGIYVVSLDLLYTGRTIEITTVGLLGMTRTAFVDLADITEPHELQKKRLNYLQPTVRVICTAKEMFAISALTHVFHEELLASILQGKEIDLRYSNDNQIFAR